MTSFHYTHPAQAATSLVAVFVALRLNANYCVIGELMKSLDECVTKEKGLAPHDPGLKPVCIF